MKNYPQKLIILDRDGVINFDSSEFIKSQDEWQALPNSITAIAKLSQTCTVCVATNQSGIGRGKFQQSDLDAMHAKMLQLITEAGGKLDLIEYCPHLPDANCECRKPKAGMLHTILRKLALPFSEIFMVGDSPRDLEAGLAIKATPILVLTGKGETSYKELCQQENPALNPKQELKVFADLQAFAEYLLDK